jgi:hypothetical protein
MNPIEALRRAYRWFWGLTVTAIGLTGALSAELSSPPRPLIGLAVAATGALLVLVLTQACRIMLAIARATPARQRRQTSRNGGGS